MELVKEEYKIFNKLNSPQKIQDFLDSLKFNASRTTLMSPRMVLRRKKAQCMEGALFASAVLWHHGQKPMLLDLETVNDDEYHVVALFKKFGRWGAISKTTHAVLRYREPVYMTVRELAMSYFHEYFKNDGRKTLRSYSSPIDLSKDDRWVTYEDNLWYLDEVLEKAGHTKILTNQMIRNLRPAHETEIKAGKIIEK